MKTIHPAIAEHAMEENEKLRGLLRTAWRLRPDRDYHDEHLQAEQAAWEADTATVLNAAAALSQQAEPTDTYTAVDMATAAAQGFRDGQAAAETAPVQDGRELFKRALHSQKAFKLSSATIDAAEWAWFARPAQTEQQPVKLQHMAYSEDGVLRWMTGRKIDNCELYAMPDFGRAPKLYAAPIAQTTPQPEQSVLAEIIKLAAPLIELLYSEKRIRGDGNPPGATIAKCETVLDKIAALSAQAMMTPPYDKARCAGRMDFDPDGQWCEQHDSCARYLAFTQWDNKAGRGNYRGVLVVMAARDRQRGTVEDLELALQDAEERAESAGRNASAFEDRMGDLQVESGKLRNARDRLRAEVEGLRSLLSKSLPVVEAHAGASHMLDGFRTTQNKWDELVDGIRATLTAKGA